MAISRHRSRRRPRSRRDDRGRALGCARHDRGARCRMDERARRRARPLRRGRGRSGDASRHRARLGAAGQPRSRHGATGGRRVRAGSVAGRADTRRRVRGDRPHARVVRRARCRPVLGDRTQVGRSEGCGRVARAPWPAHPAAPRRRRAGTGPARRASKTSPRGSGSAPRAPTVDVEAEAARAARVDRAGRDRRQRRCRASSASATPTPEGSLPSLLCIGVDGVEAEPILLALDQHGVAVHSGSSCSSEMLEPSPVLAAMGVDAEHSLRISVGWSTTTADVDRFVEVLPGIVERFRGLRTS